MSIAHLVALVLIAVLFFVMNRDIRQLRERLLRLEASRQAPSGAQRALSAIRWGIQILIGLVAAMEVLTYLKVL